MIRLLGNTLPFAVEVVAEDGQLFFDELWIPGIAAQNYLPCVLQNVDPGVSEVSRVLAANSLAAFHASTITPARRAALDALRKDRQFLRIPY
jgi:hypothetical protein